MNPKVFAKVKKFDLVPLATNLARQKCFVGAVTGLIQAKNVQLPQIAKGFNPDRSNEANERRLQAFLTSYDFDYQRIATMMLLFIPRGQVTFCLDRTEWAFGHCQVNVLMITARCFAYGMVKFGQLILDKKERFYQHILVDGQWLNVYLKDLNGGDLLYLAGTHPPRDLGHLYRRRWSIETSFQSFKERGFALESSHLQSLDKLKKLIALVSLAFGFCLVARRHYHQKVTRIPTKSHGYKGNSFFRKGKDKLEEWLAGKPLALDFEGALHRAYRWLLSQLTHYQNQQEIFR